MSHDKKGVCSRSMTHRGFPHQTGLFIMCCCCCSPVCLILRLACVFIVLFLLFLFWIRKNLPRRFQHSRIVTVKLWIEAHWSQLQFQANQAWTAVCEYVYRLANDFLPSSWYAVISGIACSTLLSTLLCIIILLIVLAYVLPCCCKFISGKLQQWQQQRRQRQIQQQQSHQQHQLYQQRQQQATVQNLEYSLNKNEGSITFDWDPPQYELVGNHHYSYCIKLNGVETHLSGTQITLPNRYCARPQNSQFSVEPLSEVTFEVQPLSVDDVNGQWSRSRVFVDWHCQLRIPPCQKNRIKLGNGKIYDFCSVEHRHEFSRKCCLYNECTRKKQYNPSLNFCGPSHKRQAFEQQDFRMFIQVMKGTEERMKLQDDFQRKWSNVEVMDIMEVLNPALKQCFDRHQRTLLGCTEKRYHGTKLACDVLAFYEMCSQPNCGVCGIAQEGLNSHHIQQSDSLHFYLDPSRAHLNNSASYRGTFAILLCDAVSSKKNKSPELVLKQGDVINACYVFLYKIKPKN